MAASKQEQYSKNIIYLKEPLEICDVTQCHNMSDEHTWITGSQDKHSVFQLDHEMFLHSIVCL